MKKFIVGLVAAVAAMGLMASGLSHSNTQAAKASEPAHIQAACAEGDTHVGSEGFGRCSKCNCKAFEGRGETCRNCGHAYKKHY